MAKYRFTATHGVEFSDTFDDGTLNTWAAFKRDEALDSPEGGRGYVFETDDAKAAARLRKVDDYGITDVSKGGEELPEETPLVLALPAGNAGKAAWVDYAAAHGMTRDEAAERTVKELQEHFTNLRPVEQETPGQPLVPPAQPRPNAQND
jgi:hypothetical protein